MTHNNEAVDKDTRKLIKLARKAGWIAKHTAGGHLLLFGPKGIVLTASSTPGNRGSVRQLRDGLRKAGVV